MAYYFELQLMQILRYWILGILIGSIISVFAKEYIHKLFRSVGDKKTGLWGIIIAAALGIASPLCMYGTIPIAASFSKSGMKDDLLASFMMSSILLNPQLLVYSAALGTEMLLIRVLSCFCCGILAGILIRIFYREKKFFDFKSFEEPTNNDTAPNRWLRLIKNIQRNIKATGPWFLLGILLSALFQRYVPSETFAAIFGSQRGFGVLMAATVGVPLYICGGGTIPLLLEWLNSGMSPGAATAFMITGPASKITNLGALKIALGVKHFLFYLLFFCCFALISGTAVNLFYRY